MCEWLLRRGCTRHGALAAAAKAGQQEMVEWLLGQGDSSSGLEVIKAAARGGHVGLIEWLIQTHPDRFDLHVEREKITELLCDVARGCDLAMLQRQHQAWLEVPRQRLPNFTKTYLIAAAAARSPTPDWRAKVQWLEGRGRVRTHFVCTAAAACPDAAERLAWLRQRGYPVGWDAAETAARAGNLAALQYLYAEGFQVNMSLAKETAGKGHLAVVAWLVEVLGVKAQLDEDLFNAAAESGNLELLMWLRERGCPWGESTFGLAALGGNEAALEWLAEQGCPMGANGQPYNTAVCQNDPATLRCLGRLGCPWGPPGEVLSRALKDAMTGFCEPEMLRVLLDAGCPVDWQAAESELARDCWKECTIKEGGGGTAG